MRPVKLHAIEGTDMQPRLYNRVKQLVHLEWCHDGSNGLLFGHREVMEHMQLLEDLAVHSIGYLTPQCMRHLIHDLHFFYCFRVRNPLLPDNPQVRFSHPGDIYQTRLVQSF